MPKNRKSVPRVDKRETVPFGKLNYILFAAGLLLITAGWFLLRAGHISISPLMLILGILRSYSRCDHYRAQGG